MRGALVTNNKTKDILKIAENVLGAKISLVKNDMDATVNQLRVAVAAQDSLKYDEPQDWFIPCANRSAQCC